VEEGEQSPKFETTLYTFSTVGSIVILRSQSGSELTVENFGSTRVSYVAPRNPHHRRTSLKSQLAAELTK